jgi:hypothetical protein
LSFRAITVLYGGAVFLANSKNAVGELRIDNYRTETYGRNLEDA